ncbi:MAG: flagellar hook-associated protein FlgK [Oscillospiraceae bacterium]|jgi:flagellar hook-associated protein 1 FlgK|nr:flagellar hook-associated protein FlgK [Oscillospiraceae bacterium]
MRSTFFGLEIARTGLIVSQKGLDVTGHNIANVDTAGYTRQRIVTTAYEPYSAITQFKPVERGLVGAGAKVVILDQIRSKFLDLQFREENTLYSYWATRTQGLNYVESLFEGSDDSSLNASVNKLFSAFNALGTEGNDKEQRKLIQQSAINLTTNFGLIYERLVGQQADQNLAVQTNVHQINTIAQSIAVLNKSIYSYELDGQPANDLRDKRNLLLDQLSSLADIEYEETAENKMVVKIGGVELVNHLKVNTLECREEDNPIPELTGKISVPVWSHLADADPDKVVRVTGGELKAHLDLRDNGTAETPGIPYFVEQLNNLARILVQSINEVHREGYTHSSNPDGTSLTGTNFFDEPADIMDLNAGNMKVTQAIIDSEYNIAASTKEDGFDAAGNQKGNQENAKALYELLNRSDLMIDTGGGPGTGVSIGSFNSYITGLLLDIAITLEHSKDMTDTQNVQVLSVDNQRMSISGVSLDEEMTSLIKYQHAYSGAARVLTAMDEALDLLINRMGLVGRS